MKEKLHIAHFTNTYYPVMSGVVRSISTFRQAQENIGHNVFVFAQGASDHQDKEPFIFRYPSLNIPVRNYPVTIPVSSHVDWVIKSLKLDVIHAHHPAPMGTAASDKAEKLNIPLVFTHHTRYQEYVQYMGIPDDLVVEMIERLLADYMKKCQHIIAPSPSIKKMIEETYGIREGVTVLPTGIDLIPYRTADGRSLRQERGWRDDETVIVSVGRLVGEKNFNTLINAASIVMAQQPNVRLAIVGDGPSRSDLEKQAKKLGIADRVDFIGQIPFEDVTRHLKAADLFSFASVTETQGLVTLEAMAADLPVVAVDATGTSDIVEDGKDGLLTANDKEALAKGILRLIKDDDLQSHLRKGAIQKAELYEINRVTQNLIGVYQQAIVDKANGRYIQTDERKPIYKVAWTKLFERFTEPDSVETNELVVLAFEQQDGARNAITKVKTLQAQGLIYLDDAAIVTRKQSGRTKVTQASELVGSGNFGNTFWGMFVGTFFLVPWLGLAVGTATGTLVGKFADIGVDKKFIKDVSQAIKPGQSALFLLVNRVNIAVLEQDFVSFDCQILHTALSDEDEAQLRAAFGAE